MLTRDPPAFGTRPSAPAGAPLKVLIFNSSLQVGGAQTMSIALANALAHEGLTVFFASSDGPLRGNLDNRVTFLLTCNPNHAPVRVAHEMLKYLRHYRPDLVHSHGGVCSLVAAIAVKASRVRCARVLTHHSRVFRRAPRWVSGPVVKRCADHYIAISHDKQHDLKSLGIGRERISLVPNFVDVERIAARVADLGAENARATLGIPKEARVLAMAGRLIGAKGFDHFVRIAAEVARFFKEAPIHALVVGDGPELDAVRRVADREGSPAKIHVVGYQRDLLPYLAASEVVVFPSRHPEVLPMFLIEASAAGLPIVCSDIPGNREVVKDGRNGFTVGGGTSEYTARVREILSDRGLAARMSAESQRLAREHFDRAKIVRVMLEVYASLCSPKPAHVIPST